MAPQTTTAPVLAPEEKLNQLVVFTIGDEEFGVPIGEAQRIIKVTTITPLPDSPEFIKGLVNVRGEIVPIIDLKKRFFLKTEKETSSKHIVITRQAEGIFGLLVDEGTEVLRISATEIKPPPEFFGRIHEEYVTGIATHEGRLIIILDLARVLSQEELARLSALTRQHTEGGPTA